MKTFTASSNADLLKTLDAEGILLSDYLMILVEKALIKQGFINPKPIEKFLEELE